jgi:hypothetical protein
MFREAEYSSIPRQYKGIARAEPILHQTYITKPKPVLQLQSENAEIDYYGRNIAEAEARAREVEQRAIPTTWDTMYDPDHPSADYAGLVNIDEVRQRKHMRDHSSQRANIVQNENGITGTVERSPFSNKPRHIPKSDPANILGGMDVPNAERYRTTTQRQSEFDGLSPAQLTIEKRMGSKMLLKDPAQNTASLQDPFYDGPEEYSAPPSRAQYAQMAAARAAAEKQRAAAYIPKLGASLMGGLAESIMHNVAAPHRAVSRENATPRSRSKVLLTENYSTKMPGYTGARK